MSFALQVGYKTVIFGLIVAMAIGLMVAVGSLVVDIFNEIDVSLDGSVSAALTQGRMLANIFINPHVFNACIGLWLGLFPVALGYSFGIYIQKLLDL